MNFAARQVDRATGDAREIVKVKELEHAVEAGSRSITVVNKWAWMQNHHGRLLPRGAVKNFW